MSWSLPMSDLRLFRFYYSHDFESDFEIDGAKLMRFSDIIAIITASLILFMYHTCEFDLQ